MVVYEQWELTCLASFLAMWIFEAWQFSIVLLVFELWEFSSLARFRVLQLFESCKFWNCAIFEPFKFSSIANFRAFQIFELSSLDSFWASRAFEHYIYCEPSQFSLGSSEFLWLASFPALGIFELSEIPSIEKIFKLF